MLSGKKIIVVMPAYNAEETVFKTVEGLPDDIIDEIILVDDESSDNTVDVASKLNLKIFRHHKNMGYGRNQKTCYREALKSRAEIVVMVHPDYQYEPRLALPMAGMIAGGTYDVVIGSRIIGGGALKGGMPLYKYIANRILTLFQNILMATKLSEFHTGYRAFSRKVLETLPLEDNSDDFVFDNQMIAQIFYFGYSIGEISCPTSYFEDASSIGLLRSIKYGFGVIATSIIFRLQKWNIGKFRIFSATGNKLLISYYNELKINNDQI